MYRYMMVFAVGECGTSLVIVNIFPVTVADLYVSDENALKYTTQLIYTSLITVWMV